MAVPPTLYLTLLDSTLDFTRQDPDEAEDEEDCQLILRRRARALKELQDVLGRHNAPAYRHSMMSRAGELYQTHLDALRREERTRLEVELREELAQDRSMLEKERGRLHEELEQERTELREREETLRERLEERWAAMKVEFETRARGLARRDLEPLAKEIVDTTEKKAGGRRCSLM